MYLAPSSLDTTAKSRTENRNKNKVIQLGSISPLLVTSFVAKMQKKPGKNHQITPEKSTYAISGFATPCFKWGKMAVAVRGKHAENANHGYKNRNYSRTTKAFLIR